MTTLDRYTITETLHEGTAVALYRGVRTRDGLPVVIKALRAESPAPRKVERLRHEYEILRQIDSPYALKPYELETHESRLMLIVEDSGCEPLARQIGPPMEPGRFLTIAIQLAAALADIHRLGVIHKDIKPANILIHPHTAELKLSDFGIAAPLTPMPTTPANASLIEGSLAYMAPEQTRRLNCGVDHRSDLYSLGVTCYEMLTGALPFQAADPLEWVHCHIARAPQSPRQAVPAIPEPIAAIVMKLLAKQAEQRYQSARGLRFDLERCHAQWQALGRIEPFPLGDHDVSELFLIPQKLYGREEQVAALLSAFEQVLTTGQPAFMLVSGYSGIGKSALVRELHQPIVRARGFFIAGKFDQHQRDIPYATIAPAFHELIQQVLTESDERIARWQAALHQALDADGQLIIDIIPQLELIIGPQPPVMQLPPTAAQHRFHRVFQQFIGVFAQQDHPLALFLDDLQWLDPASLQLIAYLITHPETRYLFLIGAYRDNEVSPSHPLLLTLDEIRTHHAPVQEIVLGPLTLGHLQQLVADTVHRPAKAAAPLARLVYTKTAGSPFFAIQFLTTLYQERLLTYDERKAHWRWDVPAIRRQGFTDNVVELMAGKLKRFSAATQAVLTLAACIGNSVDAGTLALICDRSEDQLHTDLWDAVNAGLLLRLDGTYQFLHDRVQEAAYSLLPDTQQVAQHLRIGRLLLAHTPEERLARDIFAIVSQLNRGAALMTSQEERERLAELNLIAGRRAKALTAFTSARSYFAVGTLLLGPDAWETRYDLASTLILEQAESEYLVGNFAHSDELLTTALDHVITTPDRIWAYRLRQRLYQLSGRFHEAMTVALGSLRLFGISFPEDDKDIWAAIESEIRLVSVNLRGRRIADLVEIPLTDDAETRALIGLLEEAMPLFFTARPLLWVLINTRGVNLCLQQGHANESPFIYSGYAMILVGVVRDISSAIEFSEMAITLNERFPEAAAWRGKLLFHHGAVVNIWGCHFSMNLPLLNQAFQASLDSGDIVNACYLTYNAIWLHLENGEPLEQVVELARRYAAFTRQSHNDIVYHLVRVEEQFALSLRGETRSATDFSNAAFDEAGCLTAIEQAGFGLGIAYHHIMKQIAAFLAGRYDEALEWSGRAAPMLLHVTSMANEATHHFYHALTLAALYGQASVQQQQEFMQSLREIMGKLKFWADHCPDNFANRYALVSAEVARIERRDLDAERLYEEAIRSAKENGFVQNEALAYELAARFYRARGFALFADTYLREARACYARWGADGKVQQIDQHYPQQVDPRPLATTTTFAVRAEQIDLLAVIKASQAISDEILLPDLQQTLLRLVLQSAGAQRGFLLLAEGEQLTMHAQAELAGEQIRVTVAPELPVSATTLPRSILSYVRRTGESVVLADATADGRYAADPYIVRQRPRSVLGLPIMRQAQIVGLLYLENNLIAGAFTPNTLTVLELLAAQAAISLETALLYANLQQENNERRRAEAKYRSIFEHAGEGIFQTTPAGIMLTANPAMAQMLGYATPADLLAAITDIGTQLYVAPERRAELLQLLETHDTVQHFEAEFYRKDHSRIWVSSNIRVVRDDQSAVRYYEGMSEDITERKRAEAALRRSEERYRDLYDNAPDGYCVVDADGCIREMNGTQLTWLGYHRREVIGQLWLNDVLLPEGRPQVRHLLDWCKREGQIEHVEQTLVCHDGRYVPVRLNMRAIRNATGHCTGYRVTMRDIAKEKELEAQLLQAQKLESLGTLVGGIAHDFNNMLTSIMGFTELVLLDVAPETQIHEDLRRIEMLSRRAADMVRQLLTFSRRSQSQKTSLPLGPFLEEITGLLGRTIPETVTVDLRLAAENLVVEADPTQLQQVVMNLAVNARDAMPAGGRLVIATARVELDDAFCQVHPDLYPGWYARLSVSDTGVGIPLAIRPRIFDPFFTTKGVGQGTGLGLPVVYGIVKNHAGAIEVESQAGCGTTMAIYLPLSAQPVVEPAPPVDDLLTGIETILLVEDEPLVLTFGRTALERFGYRVLTAPDGVAALEVFQAHQDEIALVILDVVMPRMGGRATARELKRRKPTVAVLLATGYAHPEATGEDVGEPEAYAVLQKPYRIRQLAQAVRAVLEQGWTANHFP